MQEQVTQVSVVIPVYNESENLDGLAERVTKAMEPTGLSFEGILIDNQSLDDTRDKIVALTRRDPRWRGIFLSRNFGHQNSLFCGLSHARGEAVISIDGDLQDPPEVIPELIEKWRQGADIVSTVRLRRPGEPWWRLGLIRIFYKIMSALSNGQLGQNSGDFRLMSRRALDHLLSLDERKLYIRGLIPMLGFRQDSVFYQRCERHRGRSSMGFLRLLSFALDGLASTTVVPLRAAALLGFCSLLFSVLYGSWILFLFVTSRDKIAGWTTIVLLINLYGGLILMTLGILGEYLGRVFQEVKKRPRYVVESLVGAVEAP